MLSAWLNAQVTIQRRASTSRNVLNEPDYGPEPNYPVVYALADVRIEFEQQRMGFTEGGERVDPSRVLMYIEDPVLEEDRVTVISTDDPTLQGELFLIRTVQPEWDAVGTLHHYLCELMVH